MNFIFRSHIVPDRTGKEKEESYIMILGCTELSNACSLAKVYFIDTGNMYYMILGCTELSDFI